VPIPTGQLAGDELPDEPPELLEGILLTHGATGIVGAKETGKSLSALEIQYSLLSGTPLWQEIKPPKQLKKTVHFYAEHTAPTLMGLWRRMWDYRIPPDVKSLNLRIFGPEDLAPHKLLVSSGMRIESAVSRYKKMAEGAGLVVFDPLAAFIQGEEAENSNAPMRALVDAMIEIAQSSGAACLVLGHQGKPQFDDKGRSIRKYTYLTRGASGTEDALTAIHYLDRLEDDFGADEVYQLTPARFKGVRRKPMKLLRDSKTCRQRLLIPAIRRVSEGY